MKESGGNKAGPDFTPSDDETSNEESVETKIKLNPFMRERYIHSLKSYRKYQSSVEEIEATVLSSGETIDKKGFVCHVAKI